MIHSFSVTIFQARKAFLARLALTVLLFSFQGSFSQQDPFKDFWCWIFPSDPNCSQLVEPPVTPPPSEGDAIEQVIREKYQYTPLVPVNTLFSPGTIVLIKQTDPFEAEIVCTQENIFGSSINVPSSGTAEFLEKKEFELSLEAKAGLNGLIEAKGLLGHLNGYKLSLENPELFALTDAIVFDEVELTIPNFTRGCARAVKERLLNKDQLTMIKSAIKGNANYELDIETEGGIDAGVQLQIAQLIAPKINLNAKDVTHNSIKGQELYWGVKDDAFLFHAIAKRMIDFLDDGRELGGEPFILEEPTERHLIPVEAEVRIILDAP